MKTLSKIGWIWAKRFVAGRDFDEARAIALRLAESGYPLIFNYASEHVEDIRDVQRAVRAYYEAMDFIKEHKINAALSVKLSQFNLLKNWYVKPDTETMLLTMILNEAQKRNIKVMFDAEYLTYREYNNDVLNILWSYGYKNIGRVVQSYGPEWDFKWFIKKCIGTPMPVRVCKGAYRKEPSALNFKKDYEKIIGQFNYAVSEFLAVGIETEIATHDNELIGHWADEVKKNPKARFAMLLGINSKKAEELKTAGTPPNIYLIFGPNWFGYLKRRLKENPNYIFLPFQK